jgi:sec-independent protein translocase protein TatC
MINPTQAQLTALENLRKRLIVAGGSWLLAFAACWGFSEKLFLWISAPVRAALPEGTNLVFLSATEPFFTYLKLSAVAALLIALPVVLWQLWAFVADLVKPEMKPFALGFVLAGSLCFALGAWFGFTFTFPTIMQVLLGYGIGPGDAAAMLSMASYLSLATTMLLAFGLVFELPLVLILLARFGLVDAAALGKHRRYMLIVAFVFGALITPGPDVISQCSIAIPFVILYEVGIVGARIFGRKRPAGMEAELPTPPVVG